MSKVCHNNRAVQKNYIISWNHCSISIDFMCGHALTFNHESVNNESANHESVNQESYIIN